MAQAIKKVFGIESELVGGSGGVFDVKCDGHLIFSKHEKGRFPMTDEIIKLLES